jgi:glutamine synthetase type III
MYELREYVDELENPVNDELWPLPKFWEMLFIS